MTGRHIFSVSEESDSGGVSHCWVERKRGGYCMFGNELGRMSGPCDTVAEAVQANGFQFGMDYMEIEASINVDEMRTIITGFEFIWPNVSVLTVNGRPVKNITIHGILREYEKTT